MKNLIQLILTTLMLTLFLPKSYAIVQPKTAAIMLIEKPTDSQNEPSKKTKILANVGMTLGLAGLGVAIVGLAAVSPTGIAFGLGVVLSLIGLVLSIITLTRKDKNKKIKLKSWLGMSGIGLIALIVLALIWISSQ
jgi:hypothetical protein